MIELNLLPEEFKIKKRKKIELPEIPFIPVLSIFITVLLVIQIGLYAMVFMGGQKLAKAKEEWQKLEPKKKELEEIKKQITTTNKKKEAVEGLMAKRVSWAGLLNNLSDSLTPNLWLNELSYEEKTKDTPEKGLKIRALNISGSVFGKGEEATAYVARFIQALKDNPDFFKHFDNVELVSIKQGYIMEQDVMNFILRCDFKPER